MRRSHKKGPGIVDRGSPRIGDQRDRLSCEKPIEEDRGLLVPNFVVVGGDRCADPMVCQQHLSRTRVFGGDHIDRSKQVKGTNRQIVGLSDRDANDVQRPLLSPRR